jgi:hypothetical protein
MPRWRQAIASAAAEGQQAASAAEAVCIDAHELLHRLATDGLDLSLILGGPFDGKEIPIKLRIKPATSKEK